MSKTTKIKIFILTILPFLLFASISVNAAFSPQIKIFSSNLAEVAKNNLLSLSSYNLASIDLGRDGINEIVLSGGEYNKPIIYLLRADGTEINHFFAYNENFDGGVNLAVCDLDKDNKDEIITGAGPGGSPHIRVFDSYGKTKINNGFFAGDKNNSLGVKVACADINRDSGPEIIAAILESGGVAIKFFSKEGKQMTGGFTNSEFKNDYNFKLADLDNDGLPEIVIAGGRNEKPKIKILRLDGSQINDFFVYNENFLGGVNLSIGEINNDRANEIIVGPRFTGGPHLRILNFQGNLIREALVFDSNFRGGVDSIIGNFNQENLGNEILSIPSSSPVGNQDLKKSIEINLKEQKLSYYQDGLLIDRHLVSTGKPGLETPIGEFKILNKNPKAWSSYGLWMPYWLGLGRFGIHELPIWPSGYREGANHLGKKVSHGCIRLGIGPAEELYNWAEIGTKVVIHE